MEGGKRSAADADLEHQPAAAAKLARGSESSDTASAVRFAATGGEDVNADEARKAELKRQLDGYERDKAALLNGSHLIFQERCAVLESVKVDTIAKAISHRDFQLAAIHKLFEYQKYAAECVAENGKKELMEVMLAEVNDRIKATADRLAGTHHEATKAESRAPKRSLRKTRSAAAAEGDAAGGGEGGAGGASSSGAAAAATSGASALSIALPVSDIQNDMKEIYRDWKAAAQRWRSVAATVLTPTRVERGKLYYGQESFVKGDGLAVFSELTKQEFYGTLHILAQSEVIVRLVDGTKCRIPLPHLRHGRVSLYRYNQLPAPSSGASSSSSSGGSGGGGGGSSRGDGGGASDAASGSAGGQGSGSSSSSAAGGGGRRAGGSSGQPSSSSSAFSSGASERGADRERGTGRSSSSSSSSGGVDASREHQQPQPLLPQLQPQRLAPVLPAPLRHHLLHQQQPPPLHQQQLEVAAFYQQQQQQAHHHHQQQQELQARLHQLRQEQQLAELHQQAAAAAAAAAAAPMVVPLTAVDPSGVGVSGGIVGGYGALDHLGQPAAAGGLHPLQPALPGVAAGGAAFGRERGLSASSSKVVAVPPVGLVPAQAAAMGLLSASSASAAPTDGTAPLIPAAVPRSRRQSFAAASSVSAAAHATDASATTTSTTVTLPLPGVAVITAAPAPLPAAASSGLVTAPASWWPAAVSSAAAAAVSTPSAAAALTGLVSGGVASGVGETIVLTAANGNVHPGLIEQQHAAMLAPQQVAYVAQPPPSSASLAVAVPLLHAHPSASGADPAGANAEALPSGSAAGAAGDEAMGDDDGAGGSAML